MSVHYDYADGIAVVTFDNPPLNVFGKDMRAGLDKAISQAIADRAQRLIFTGAGRNFVAGSDAKEFDGPALAPHLNDILLRLASLPFPTVAALNGVALGGGLEIALACRYRIAHPKALLGLPEVTLGILPGAGGTQRLPRLVGVAIAADLIGQGRRIGAVEALEIGLVDEVSQTPLEAARALDAGLLHKTLAPDHRPAPSEDPEGIDAAHARATKRMPGQTAPHIAIDLVAASAVRPLEGLLIEERKTFLELRHSDQARALRHVFFAERAAVSQGKSYPSGSKAIESAIVVGGGTMGSAIAYAFASAGVAVTIVERDSEANERAKLNVEKLISSGEKRGILTSEGAAKVRSKISTVVGYEDLPAVDLAIEAAFESFDVKKDILSTLQDSLPDRTILATNTSYLDVDALAEGVRHPERFLGLHFFAPAHIMKLLEVVQSKKTSDETLGAAFNLAKLLGKMPVLAGVCDGFIGNRILQRYRHAADLLLIEGALPQEVDAAMRAYGMAMGPYEAQDLSGLDIAYANRERHNLRERTDIRYVPIADHMVETLGRLGRKTGAGWYDYDEHGKATPSDVVAKCIRDAALAEGVPPQTRSASEIARFLVLAMVAEGFDILAEGIAARPSDIDLVMIHGYGFPRWRGGLMFDAAQTPLPDLLMQIWAYADADSLSWPVPALLQKLVADRRTLDSLN